MGDLWFRSHDHASRMNYVHRVQIERPCWRSSAVFTDLETHQNRRERLIDRRPC